MKSHRAQGPLSDWFSRGPVREHADRKRTSLGSVSGHLKRVRGDLELAVLVILDHNSG